MMNTPQKRILVITGPTAVGKTTYAIGAADTFSGEIVSADSMQIYKYMDIGSAKPTYEELSRIRHHMVGVIDPAIPFSAAQYQSIAKKKIAEIIKRNKLPIITGGTGLYINSLLYDLDFSESQSPGVMRQLLIDEAELKGKEYMHERLKSLNSNISERIHPNNVKRVIRAIEILETTGNPINEFSKSYQKTTDYDFIFIGLNRDRDELYQRINRRVDELIKAGLAEEVKELMARGLKETDIAMKGIGYKEVISYFNGKYDIDEAIRLIKRNTRRYAKRQITWFKRDPYIHWINISKFKGENEAFSYMINHIREAMDSD